MSCGIGRRCSSSNPTLLWLWCRLAATAPIQPLAWEPPYDEGAALKRQKKKFQASQLVIREIISYPRNSTICTYNNHCALSYTKAPEEEMEGGGKKSITTKSEGGEDCKEEMGAGMEFVRGQVID